MEANMSNIVEIMSRLLIENDFSNAFRVINDTDYSSELKKHSWDLLPLFFKNIGKDVTNLELKKCCQDLLEVMARKVEPEEVVLEFLDQMEEADMEKFCFILKLLTISLPLCEQNGKRFLESTFVSIRSYLEEFIISDTDYLSEEEYEEELCNQLQEIVTVLNCVLEFYSFFISLSFSKSKGFGTRDMVDLFTSRLIQLYDFYLPCGDSKLGLLNDSETKLMTLITGLIHEPFDLLHYLFSRSSGRLKSEEPKRNFENEDLRKICDNIDLKGSDPDVSVFESNLIVSNLAFATYFYSIICNNESEVFKKSYIYNPKYIFLSLAFLTVSFFDKAFNKPVHKGLLFLKTLLDHLDDTKLERHELYFKFNEQILVQLNNIMVYCQDGSIRKLAVTCFKKFIESYDYEAKYLLLVNLRRRVEHSGTLGFLITLFKEYTLHALEHGKSEPYFKYYSGEMLYDIIAQYCFLPQNENTDLVQNADHVISSLNFLRFLLLRDKENTTGIRNYLSDIDSDFLKPLKKCIKSSKELYELQLHDCRQNAALSDTNKIDFSINGQAFAQLTKEEQENALKASLNAIDLIDSLLFRVKECVGLRNSFAFSSPVSGRRSLSSENKGNSQDSDASYEDNIKEKLLQSSLPFVNKHGWTTAAISDGAASIGYPGVIHGIFANPSAELIDHFNKKCNAELVQSLKTSLQIPENSTDPKQFIENALKLRLKMIIPYIEKWPQALAIMSQPANIPIAFQTFAELIDDVCYLSGDKSVNFNWYCRRGAIAVMYKSTELCMIQDKTEDYSQTWKFLGRRLDEAFTVDKILKNNENIASKLKDLTTATAVTIGNIIGFYPR